VWSALSVALLASAHAASPLELRVTDPQITSIVLECTDGTFKALVKNGVAAFDLTPNDCTIHVIRRAGRLSSAGVYDCTTEGCRRVDVHHREVSDAPGRINVIAETPLAGGSWLELSCSSGQRFRTDVIENTGVFEGVPAEECTLLFKGGPPLKYRPISQGTWRCNAADTTVTCAQQ
jgi:hypothetical protein